MDALALSMVYFLSFSTCTFFEFMRRVSWKKATSFKLDLTVFFLLSFHSLYFGNSSLKEAHFARGA